jgi:hypothetical protein
MTTPTAAPQQTEGSGFRVLLGAASWGLASALVAIVVGYLVSSEAGIGALIGSLSTVIVLAGGTWAVLKASTIAPAVGLMAALIVFTLQGVLLLVVMAVLSKVTDGDQVVAAAFSIIGVTVVWTTLFAVYVRREKIPLFDLSGASPDASGSSDGPGAE